MATILLQNLLIQLDEQLGRVSKEKNLLLIHNLKRIRKVLQVRMHSPFSDYANVNVLNSMKKKAPQMQTLTLTQEYSKKFLEDRIQKLIVYF